MKGILLLFVLSTALISGAQAAESSKWLCFKPCVVELKGIVRSEVVFGPPNFGENPKTDSRVRIYVLHLDKPIKIRFEDEKTDGPDSKQGVKKVQFTFGTLPDNIQDLVGKEVRVKGSLAYALLPSDYEDVVFWLQKAVAIDSPRSAGFDVRSITITNRASDSSGSAAICSEFRLTAAKAAAFFSRAAAITSKELHDFYDYAPCYVRGDGVLHGKSVRWEIRAFGTGEIWYADGHVQLVADPGKKSGLSGK